MEVYEVSGKEDAQYEKIKENDKITSVLSASALSLQEKRLTKVEGQSDDDDHSEKMMTVMLLLPMLMLMLLLLLNDDNAKTSRRR